jgi:hypothetical protein
MVGDATRAIGKALVIVKMDGVSSVLAVWLELNTKHCKSNPKQNVTDQKKK